MGKSKMVHDYALGRKQVKMAFSSSHTHLTHARNKQTRNSIAKWGRQNRSILVDYPSTSTPIVNCLCLYEQFSPLIAVKIYHPPPLSAPFPPVPVSLSISNPHTYTTPIPFLQIHFLPPYFCFFLSHCPSFMWVASIPLASRLRGRNASLWTVTVKKGGLVPDVIAELEMR